MARIDAKLPPGLAQLLEASGECGLFRGKSDAARTALRAYFDQNPEIAMAAIRELVSESDNDGEGMTLDEAVRLTGQSPSTFSEELRAVLCANADPQQEDGSNGT
jgi:Arc/MetJ-type ribon-helix-helix transcriptional regulator